jgi:uncharacterized protein YdaU (DUF1376 family)
VAENPWVAFYFADYLADTGRLTLAEHGAYILLLAEAYRNGGKLPCGRNANASKTHTHLHRLCRCESDDDRAAVDAVLGEFFEFREGSYIHGRVAKELSRRAERSEKASESARKRWDANASKTHMRNACESDAIHNHSHNYTHNQKSDPPAPPPDRGAEGGQGGEPHSQASAQNDEGKPAGGKVEGEEPGGAETEVVPAESRKAGGSQTNPRAKALRAKPRSVLPETWQPNLTHVQLAVEQGVDMKAEATNFRNYHEAKGSLMANWDAAFRTWLGNARRFGAPPANGNGGQPLTRQAQPSRSERIMAATASALGKLREADKRREEES